MGRRVVGAFLVLALAACARAGGVKTSLPSNRLTSGSAPEASAFSIRKLAVLPFQEDPATGQTAEPFVCPVCGEVEVPGKIDTGATADLDRLTDEVLGKVRPDWTIVEVSPPAGGTSGPAAQLGAQVGADAALEGVVHKYLDRIGGPLAAERPASVALEIHILNSSTGKLLCWGTWVETQEALSEDVLDIGAWLGRGGRWVTARELAREGLVRILEACPAVQARVASSVSLPDSRPRGSRR